MIKYKIINLPKSDKVKDYIDTLPDGYRILIFERPSTYNTLRSLQFNVLTDYKNDIKSIIQNTNFYGKLHKLNYLDKYSHIITGLECYNDLIEIKLEILNTLDGIYLNTYTNDEILNMLSISRKILKNEFSIDFTLPLAN